jgi:queuosine precursor transporter
MKGERYKYFDILMALSVAVLLISNIASTKIVSFWALTFDAGMLLFPLSYILGDVVTEVYGYARARRVIWVGFFSAAFLGGALMCVTALPPASDWPYQEAFQNILGLTPRIVLASLVAFTLGSFSNAYVLAKMKVWSKGEKLWARTIGSTLVGEGVDTIVFVLVAFFGVLSTGTLFAVIVSNYVFKCGVEVLLTPLTYKVVAFLKRSEEEDFYDRETDFGLLV